jgi:hypothetical protein
MSGYSNRTKSSIGELSLNIGIVDSILDWPKKLKDYFKGLLGFQDDKRGRLNFENDPFKEELKDTYILETEDNYYNYSSILHNKDKPTLQDSKNTFSLIEEDPNEVENEKPFKKRNKLDSLLSDIVKSNLNINDRK